MDPYATLNVPPDSSREQIRGAFVRVARSIHPDKAGSSKAANEMYSEVDEAWKVLGDAQMKEAYDLYGNSGTTALQALRKTTEATKVSKRKLAQHIQLLESLAEEEESPTSTSIVCAFHIRDLLAFVSGRETPSRFWGLQHVLMDHTVLLPLSESHSLSLHAEAGSSRNRKTTPVLGRFTVKHMFVGSLNNVFETSFSFDALNKEELLPSFSTKGTRMMSKHLSVGCEFLGHYQQQEPGFQVFGRRRLGNFTDFDCTWGFGSARGVDVGVSHRMPTRISKRVRRLDVKAKLTQGSAMLLGAWMEPVSKHSQFKSSFQADFSHFALEVESSKSFPDQRMKISGALAVTWPEGIRFKLRISKGTTKYEIPIFLTKSVNGFTLALSGGLPYVLSLVVNRVLAPNRTRVGMKRRAELEERARMLRNRARSQMQLMHSTAEANKRNPSGLVILQALYGKKGCGSANTTTTSADWEHGGLPHVIDVTVQCNFFINKSNSTLDFSSGTKSTLLGFYDPCIVWDDEANWCWDEEDDRKEVWGENEMFLRYQFQDKIYELRVPDTEALHLPDPGAELVTLPGNV